MTLIQMLSDLRSRGVVLSLEEGRLRCNAPKGVITPEIREELARRKQEIVMLLKSTAAFHEDRVEAGAAELPLSHSQRRLWFVQKMDPDNPVYHMAVAIRMAGALQRKALEDSLRILVGRHESLRTGFQEKDGHPFARLTEAETWKPAFVDLSHLTPEDAEEEARRRAVADARRPFDLDHPPLIRAVLYRTARDRHLLLLVMHHIISDGWSLGILAREIGVIYASLSAGNQPSLPALTAGFQDFVLWESERVAAASEAHLPFWLERLRGPLPQLELSGRRRPGVPTFRGQRSSVIIDSSLTDAIGEICRGNDVTPFMFLLAAFKVLLYRYTGQTDLLVGTGNSNRPRAEFSPVVGFFVDNLVLRSDLSGNPRFEELLEQVRRTTHEAYAHQELPFGVLIEKLQPQRELSRNPLFQVAFVMQNVPLEPIRLPGLSIESSPLDIGISPMDLSVGVWPEGKGYRCDLEYSTDLFGDDFIVALQAHYLNLLREVVRDPGQRIENIPLLTDLERHQLLVTWNQTAQSVPSQAIQQIFEDIARTQPDAPALIFDSGQISYRELDRMANAIAAWLIARDLPAHSFVSVCAPGSPLGIAAFLGILKAGHAYFPIAAGNPPERLRRMLDDAGATVLLTTAAFRQQFPGPGLPSIALLEDISAAGSEAFRAPSVTPEDPAYLMFTSGSTGKPKGVVIPHRGVVRLVRGKDGIRFASDEVLLQASALSFDASSLEIWGALLNGAPLVLMGSEQPTAEDIRRAIQDHAVTTLIITAALFHHLVAGHLHALRPLRQVVVGGDILSPVYAARLLREAPHIRLVNAYGPTENATNTTTHTVRPDSLDAAAIPIGRPINNTRVFLLDVHRQPVPVGVPGELYVAGDGLAIGYLNAPEETERAFVALHFSETGSVRAYRTGDVARYRSDGALEFLGRTDNQVKVQGYRVEPGEVEEALLSMEGIRAAVVAPRTWPDGDRRLVAYVVTDGRAPADSHDWQLQLRRILPRPQIPAAFLPVADIPRTPNGKIDYALLDALPLAFEPARAAGRGAGNQTEEVLLGIFSDLLRVQAPAVEDDFFSLGGHSLLAMQLLSRIKVSFGVTLSVAEVFLNPTVEALAARIEAAGGTLRPSGATKRDESPAATREHALSRAQRRLWFLDQMDPGNPVYNIAIPLRLEGPLNRNALESALRTIILRHESLRTRFLQRDGLPYAMVEDAQGWSVDCIDLSSLPPQAQEEALGQFIQSEAQHSWMLEEGPLFRVTLYRMSDRQHVVLIGMHHIISDGWSMGVLAHELGRIYEAEVKGLPCPLPPLPVQFRDFVQWESEQEKRSSSEDLAYWRKQLGGELPQLNLPADRPRPAVQIFRGQRIVLDFDAELEAGLQKLAREHNATFFMVLLAAFSVLLRHYTRQEDILIGTPTAGRMQSSFEGLIGFFVNNLALRIDLTQNPTFRDVLHRVRHVSLEAFEHQSTPFDQLVEMLQPERSLDRSPIFQVLFTLQNTTVPRLRFDAIEMKAMDLERSWARFDLAVDVYPFEDRFRCSFEFSTDIFEEATVRQMLQHYMRILRMISADAARPVRSLRLLDAAERRQQIEDWNRTASPPPAHATVTSWFRAQARNTPETTALVMGDRTVTYRELDADSDRLAAELRSRGIGRGTVVGICLRRSPEMITGLLGILKAGAAYLPLDPALPDERIRFMLMDAEVPLILTERRLEETLPSAAAVHLVLEELGDTVPERIPADELRSDDLAYLIYTSGSTGTPKGTEIQHGALVNLLDSMMKEPGLAREDTLVAITTLSFDIAGLEIFGPLLCGAKLVLATREQVLDPELLADLLDSCHATVMQATPSVWRMLVDSGWTGRPGLRMWCGGEALTPDLAGRLMARGGELWNLYGPTETTIWSAAHRVRSGEDPVLIGRPIANTQMYILDENLEPVPVGVAGELYIGGHGVARGYWRCPELTASRFVPDPFDSTGARKMYRTGDLARYRRDGEIQLLGRTDHQIKLRGHRIELGEIEAVIERHPAVRQAVVALQGEGASRQLVAYLCCGADSVATEGIRAWLHERLPEYMVPAVLVPVEALPMTPNGKIDRKRLPSTLNLPRESRADSVSARNRTEQRISDLWADALHIERPGIRENFFDLGGHSLLLVQLHAQLKREFNINISVVDLFRYPTIEALASFVDRSCATASWPVGAQVQ
jgi:amino acid adenylation domain-containing protein